METVDADFDRLAVAHVRQLGLLEIRHHKDRIQRYHRHQLRSGLHELTDPQRPRADRSVNGCCDPGVGQVQRRLLRDRAGAIELRDRLGLFGGEHVDLLLRSQQAGLAVLKLRRLFAQCRVSLLRALNGAGARLHQAVVTGLFFLRELQRGFGSRDVGGALFDQRLLQGDLGIEVTNGGFSCGDICIGLVECRPEIAIVDPRQQLAGLDRLVVADQHLTDIARHLRRDDGGIGLHIGVVGGFEISPGGPVAVAGVGADRGAGQQGQYQSDPPQLPARRHRDLGRGDFRSDLSGLLKTFGPGHLGHDFLLWGSASFRRHRWTFAMGLIIHLYLEGSSSLTG